MLGAIVGDIVGSRFEFNNTDLYDFELFTQESSYTDDTICTIAIADAINRRNTRKDGDPCYAANLLRWCRKYPNPMGGYGGSFARWIHSEQPQPYNSFGNGSAMRVAPVAWAFNSLEDVRREAERTAIVTHNHPDGIKGAVAVAHAIYSQRNGFDPGELEIVGNLYYPGFLNAIYTPGVFNETCQGTVPICLKIVRYSSSFEDAIRKAISWGGDSDTIAAIVGSLAEPIWGIPGAIKQKALDLLPDDMKAVYFKFYSEAKMDQYKSIYYYEQKQSTGSR